MKNMHVILVVIFVLLCSGCTGKSPSGDKAVKGPDTYNYTCEDGTKFTASFDNARDNMTLTMEGKSLTLIHLISGSGTRYGDGEITYWGKGDTAMLIRGDKITNCKVVGK